jgi:hypothetical protein
MKEYLLSLLLVSLAVAIAQILAPNASASYVKLIGSLIFICVLAAPLPRFLQTLPELSDRILHFTDGETSKEEYENTANDALENASKAYLAQALTKLLEERFSIPAGEVRCVILWAEGEDATPERVSVILSGSAIWKNPAQIEGTVTELLGCPCVTAIEAHPPTTS